MSKDKLIIFDTTPPEGYTEITLTDMLRLDESMKTIESYIKLLRIPFT